MTFYFIFEEEKYPISFLYFMPRDAECDVYFVLPNNEIVRNSSSINNFEMVIRPHEDSAYLRYATLITTDATEAEREGDYQFIIEQHFENETKRLVRPFKIKLVLQAVNEAENFSPDQFYAYSIVGRVYSVMFEWFKRRTMEKFPIVNASIDVLSQMSFSNGCGYKPVPAADATRECGIVSVVTLVLDDEPFLLKSFGNQTSYITINVILNVTKSCSLLSRIVANDFSVHTTLLNITAMEVTIPDAQQLQNVMIIEMPNWGRESSVKMTNETFHLRCLIPACDWDLVGWCKIDSSSGKKCAWYTRKRDIQTTIVEVVAEDPNIIVRFQLLSNYTAAMDLIIRSVQLNHTGVYGCAKSRPNIDTSILKAFENPEYLPDLPLVKFRLAVLEPVKPSILNARNGVEDYVIKKGGEQELLCQIEKAVPEPTITWRQYSDDRSFEHDSGNFSATLIAWNTNRTSLNISKPGLFECQANNFLGVARRKFRVNYERGGVSTVPIAVAISVALIVAVSIIGLVALRKYRIRKALFKELADLLKEPPNGILLDSDKPLNEQASSLRYNRNYELPRESFQLIKLIGEGEFGQVYSGVIFNETENGRMVAVKMPSDATNIKHSRALMSEMLIMCHIRPHINVVSLIGTCTVDMERGKLFVLTEFCRLGSLRDYIIKHYEEYYINYNIELPQSVTEELLSFAYQAANGMEHLSSLSPPIIHRDLALRNLLLTSDKVVKISDFGLSRQDPNYLSGKSNEKLPIPWMALESVLYQKYSRESDVWSFGIVLWEIFSFGRIPYAEIQSRRAEELCRWLDQGNRLEKPTKQTPNTIYNLMLECWKKDPSARPTFSQCKRHISHHLEKLSPGGYSCLIGSLSAAWENQMFTTRNNQSLSNQQNTTHQGQSTDADAVATTSGIMEVPENSETETTADAVNTADEECDEAKPNTISSADGGSPYDVIEVEVSAENDTSANRTAAADMNAATTSFINSSTTGQNVANRNLLGLREHFSLSPYST